MYFAVFKDSALVGLYEDAELAVRQFRAGAEEIVAVNDLEHLKDEMARRDNSFTASSLDEHIETIGIDLFDGLSSALEKCFKTLDEKGLSPEKAGATIREQSKKVAVKVKSLGIKGMNGLRDRLRTLADVLEEAASEDERPLPHSGSEENNK